MQTMERLIRLAAVKGIAGERWLSAAAALSQTDNVNDALAMLNFSEEQYQQFRAVSLHSLTQCHQWLAASDTHHFLTALDKCYPAALREIPRFPPILYINGDPAALATPQIAVIGSRDCSWYGRQWGEWFTQQLSLSGLTITSGLARGIDGIAHRAALNAGGKTVAVLGSGLLHLYPKNHRLLANDITEKGGAVISEFPLATLPHAHNFPRRNRIISGLSQGVLVVEATLKSGSLVTARYALEQNRNVYALPGALGNAASEGVHWLIQQGALLVAHPNNIIEDLNTGLHWLPLKQSEAIYSCSDDDAPLPFAKVLANVGNEVTPVDVVAERAGQPVPVVASQLLELELAGWIAAVPGGYVRLRRACHVRRTNVLI